jgi:hypothetical protein
LHGARRDARRELRKANAIAPLQGVGADFTTGERAAALIHGVVRVPRVDEATRRDRDVDQVLIDIAERFRPDLVARFRAVRGAIEHTVQRIQRGGEACREELVRAQHLQHRPQLFTGNAGARLLELPPVRGNDALDHEIAVLIDGQQRARLMSDLGRGGHADAGPTDERERYRLRKQLSFHSTLQVVGKYLQRTSHSKLHATLAG